MTDARYFVNCIYDPTSTLAGALGAGTLTAPVAAGQGSRFGSNFPVRGVIFSVDADGDPTGLFEIVEITARTTDSLTITRAQESTTAQVWASGDYIVAGVTAGIMQAILDGLRAAETAMADHDANALGSFHGISWQQDLYTFPVASFVNLSALRVTGVLPTAGQYLRADPALDGQASWQDGDWSEYVTTVTRSRSLIALADVTDLIAPLLEFSIYEFEAWISFYTAATTTGIQLAMNHGSISGNFPIHGKITIPLTTTTEQIAYFKAIDSGVTTPSVPAAGAANVMLAKIEGVIHTAGSANLAVRWGSEVAGSNVFIGKGSTLRVKRVGPA